MDNMDSIVSTLIGWLTLYGVKIIAALVIFVIGKWVARKLGDVTEKLMVTREVDAALVNFTSSLVYYALLVIVVIAALGQIGIQTASFVAIVGAAGLAIGLALQGTLSNVAAGVMLLLLRPFTTGDWVGTGNVSGTIREVGLFTTIIDTFDNVYVSIPNSSIWNSTITNHSHYETRRIDVDIGIHYDTNLDLASEVLLKLAEDERVLDKPKKPQFLVIKIGY